MIATTGAIAPRSTSASDTAIATDRPFPACARSPGSRTQDPPPAPRSTPARPVALAAVVLRPVARQGVEAEERDRSKVPERYTWNLADIYPNEQAWTREKDKFVAEIPDIERFKGHLADSPASLLQCLELRA